MRFSGDSLSIYSFNCGVSILHEIMTNLFLFILAMCLVQNAVLACKLFKSKALTCEEIKEVLDLHNLKRKEVASGMYEQQNQSKAEDMREMKWDPELAEKSQKYANRCQYKHDPDSGEGIGENLAWRTYPTSKPYNLTQLIYQWFDELFTHGYNGTWTHEAGHYITMVWSSFEYMGCGHSTFESPEPFKKDYAESFIVCRYRPHTYAEYAYIQGSPDCSKHHLQESIKFPGLCSPDPPKAQADYNPCKHIKAEGSPSGDAHGSESSSLKVVPTMAILLLSVIILFCFK